MNNTHFNKRGIIMAGNTLVSILHISSTRHCMDSKLGDMTANHMIAYRLEEKQRFWRRILIVDDEVDVAITFKTGIEDPIAVDL